MGGVVEFMRECSDSGRGNAKKWGGGGVMEWAGGVREWVGVLGNGWRVWWSVCGSVCGSV